MGDLAEGPVKRVQVNRGAILENRKDVIFLIRSPGEHTIFCGRVEILGPSEMVMASDEPEGRRVFVETTSAIRYS